MRRAGRSCRVVVLISGRGTNLQSLIDGWRSGALAIDLCGVISNEPGAQGLQRAVLAGIPTAVVDQREFSSRTAFDLALQKTVGALAPDLVVLAGFMKVLSKEFVDHFAGRMLNIHPSLLPRHPGLNTHRRAIAAGDTEHGASVHFVTGELDGGPVIVQARVPIRGGDTPERLAERVLGREHQIFPIAVRWYAEGKLATDGAKVYFEGQPLSSPILHQTEDEAIRQ